MDSSPPEQTTQTTSITVEEKIQPRPRVSARGTFAALSYPNFRLWFYGQLVSLFGTWMQVTAQGYLIFQLTHSPAYLGYVGFAAGVPAWLFTLHGGLIADRIPRRNLMVITQTSMMILAFILAGLTFTGLVQPWQIVVLAFLLGVANAFDAPARQAFVVEMVDREDLTNAIALNSTMFNLATATGPAVAGLTYALLGPAWCFTINGLSFIAVIIALLLMKLKPFEAPQVRGSAMADIKEGLRYVASNRVVATIIANLGMVSLFGFSFSVLLPAWAVSVLGGNATTNGLLQSARGLGSLLSALMIAAFGTVAARGKLLSIGNIVFPALLLVFTLVRWIPLSLLVMVGVGWGLMVIFNISNSLVQTQVPDRMRGRVMGIYTLVSFGPLPVGALLAGAAADRIGEPLTVAIGGLLVLVFAIWIMIKVPEVGKSF